MSAALIATLIYLGILVAALAAGLIAIAWRLTAAAKAITEIRDALAEVQANSKPLADSLDAINGALAQLGKGLGSVKQQLLKADSALERIARKRRGSAA